MFQFVFQSVEGVDIGLFTLNGYLPEEMTNNKTLIKMVKKARKTQPVRWVHFYQVFNKYVLRVRPWLYGLCREKAWLPDCESILTLHSISVS